jgi:hypothetical protein
MPRHSFSGAPALTNLTGSINSTATTLGVVSTAGWPDTAIGNFVIVVDSEKMLCSAYTSTSVTVATRGYDGTTAVGHNPGSAGQVFPCLDATQFDAHDAFVWNNGSVTPSTSAIGDTAVDGTSQWSAAADHKHAREVFASGATTSSAPGDSASAGTSVSPARADHKHAREASQAGLPVGLTGAVAPARFVGGTTSGAPSAGTFAVGDFVIDQTGGVWICTVAGTPGTWVGMSGAQPWQVPTYQNSWQDAGGSLAGYRISNGRVWFQGIVNGGASGTVAFTLPTAYRPTSGTVNPNPDMTCFAPGNVVPFAFMAVTGSSGTVAIEYPSSTTAVFLDGVSFALS